VVLTRSAVVAADEPLPEGPEIRWSAPPECPGEAELRANVRRRRARAQAGAAAPAGVSAEVTRDPTGAGPYRLRLTITDRRGGVRERRIEGETCADVADAAAVVVALASDDELSDRGPAPAPAPARPIDVPQAGGSAEPPPLPERSVPAVWAVAALGGVDVRSLPAPAPGFGLGVLLALGANRFELGATAWLPERANLASQPSAGGEVALYAAAVRYCRSLTRGVLDLAPCAGVEAGAMVGSGVGVQTAGTAVGPWLAPELGLGLTVHPIPRFGLSLELDGLGVLLRDRFLITRGGQVFEPPPLTARAVVGLDVRFP
jgi:hypothetical protein